MDLRERRAIAEGTFLMQGKYLLAQNTQKTKCKKISREKSPKIGENRIAKNGGSSLIRGNYNG